MTAPRIIAHRGASDAHPDNSWAAFRAAVAEGADAIECDVQSCRTSEIVTRHDLELGGRLVADLTFSELVRAEPDIVRFSELLAFAEDVRIDLLVELKDPDLTDAIADLVASSNWRDHVVIGGFHGPALARLKARAPRLATSLMVGSVLAVDDLLRLGRSYRVDGLHLCWESRAPRPHRLVDRPMIGALREAGFEVTLWHEERASELAALVALGPSAICTNTPRRLGKIIDEHLAVGVAS